MKRPGGKRGKRVNAERTERAESAEKVKDFFSLSVSSVRPALRSRSSICFVGVGVKTIIQRSSSCILRAPDGRISCMRPVSVKRTRSQMLVTRSPIRSRLCAAQRSSVA